MTDTPSDFASLGLRENILTTLAALGYEAPTPIQARTIPALLAGKDVIGQAQTGTGKTAAFALPLLERIDPSKKETQALILAPTRELAMQVAEAIHSYSRGLGVINVLPVYGGAPIVLQMKHLERGAHVVVGTPGRLIDHLDRKTLRLGNLRMIVLDEADEMLKMGFIDDVERILSEAPKERQIALFSATMPDEVLRIAKRHLNSPVRIEVEQKNVAAPAIEQRFLNVSEGQKLDVLTQILELEPSEGVIIFRRTKNGAAELAEKLQARGFAAEAMHGDMTQTLREAVIRKLRKGNVEIVVATDVAARGLDVESITHVVNYDIPYDVEAYVHRIGRTGRAGRTGVATLFITPRERGMMRQIERFTGMSIKPMKMPSGADVAARRVTVFKEAIRKSIKEGELELYVELVEQLAEEGPFDLAEVAAAAAKMANAARSLAPVKTIEPPREDRAATGSYAPRPIREGRESFAPRLPASEDTEPKVKLSMAVGKRDGIRPADVVGSIANEANVPGRDIGPIDIREDITFVTVPLKFRDQIIESTKSARFRGRTVALQVADDQSPTEPRPARKPAGFRPGGKPGFKPGGKAPYRSEGRPSGSGDYKPRFKSEGAAPRGEFKPRFKSEGRPAPRGEFKPAFKKKFSPGSKPGGAGASRGPKRPR